eukprot:9952283-Alexandrium_andersonii.AAC.1
MALRRRPLLNGVQAPKAHPSANGAPSTQMPGEIRVHTHAERDPIVLPRKVVDVPRAHDQIPRQADQRRPIRGRRVRIEAELLNREPRAGAAKAK